MTGYWLVMAMLVVAIACVVVAVAAELDGAAKRRKPAGHRPVWVALGASDAAGTGTPDPARDNWVARLATRLPPDVTVRNLGVSGSTLAQARAEQLPAALAASPDVATLWLAVNDLAAGVPLPVYERELAAVLEALVNAGARVVVGNVPDLSRLPGLADTPDEARMLRTTAEHWNAAIGRLAAAYGAEVVDLFGPGEELGAHPDYFGEDGFHPSPAGHERLAELFRPAVERALEQARVGTGEEAAGSRAELETA